jgi:glycosyltransferase involved in cell wall biosynthesis
VKLWRRFGLAVTLIPTWKADPEWRCRLEAIGCRTHETNPYDLKNVRGLSGSVVMSMCNTQLLATAERLRELGCKIIWLGCMNWLFAEERRHYRRCGLFDCYVFQSHYQRDQIAPQLAKFGYSDAQGRVIHGGFDVTEFPFRPLDHRPVETFVVGRLSRPAAEKFAPRMWRILGRVRPPMAARVMGWDASIQQRVGRPPQWAECLPAGAERAGDFLARLHCFVHAADGAIENWPRVGLEAMATGVPLVVDNRGGWTEMIRHGQTGLLCNDEDEMVEEISRLARDSQYRRSIVEQAREAVENDLAGPEQWWQQWKELLETL